MTGTVVSDFDFQTTTSEYTIWTLTLNPVTGGNARTVYVDPTYFPA